jgi:EAL domain-containing protein (putative c-di-GMP-specific phosphodiesterase class I)/ActR/RegA family two-component response regulator
MNSFAPATKSPPAYHVLLVDDEPGVLQMFRTALGNYGFTTEQAQNGTDGLQRLKNGSFDAIVSDIHMPGYGGLEFLRAVRELDLDIPVILMTGKPSSDATNSALRNGAFRCLTKPVMPATLRDTIERAVRIHGVAKLSRQALEMQGATWPGDRAALEARFALAQTGLWVAFQPLVSWSTRSVYGYEALLRTTEPTLANPVAFLEAAQRLDKLHEIGRAVRAGVAAVAPPGAARLFVNLHAADFGDEALYDWNSPLSKIADRVVLEVTERASLDGVKDLEDRIARLRRMGFKIAVDDLGAGYAGLTSFAQLQPEVAKLDMSLIRGLPTQPTKQTIVRTMQRLCTELGIAVVCEGVETPGERDALTALGCDLMQGYLFAKPGPAFPTPCW